jgi:hypothetical protein
MLMDGNWASGNDSDKQDTSVCWRKFIRYGRDGHEVLVKQYAEVNCSDII